MKVNILFAIYKDAIFTNDKIHIYANSSKQNKYKTGKKIKTKNDQKKITKKNFLKQYN